MAEVLVRPSPAQSPATVIAVQKYEGLSLEPNNNNLAEIGSDQAEAVTKEEEIITKRKTDIITTKQIETRVKRNVVCEDGKVVEDSGPIVSTNTTEDVEKQESEQTERRNLGEPDVIEGPKALETLQTGGGGRSDAVAEVAVVKELVPRPKDGLVREIKENVTLSREEKNERLEVEDVHHLGDFSDEAYVNAINSGVEDITKVLLTPEAQSQLVAKGPRVVHESYNVNKVIDTEDTEIKYKAQQDGTLVTEQKKTTQHEELYDDELPPGIENQEKVNHTESHQRYHKQKDEQVVDTVVDGQVIKSEMRYVAETENMERDGPKEEIDDWDSLSDRVRKQRRMQKSLLLRQREAAALADRTDALTKRPLDIDLEEETRKHETSKWLESHFGSESSARSSSDSRDDDPITIEPTKKTYFNVTIKSSPSTTPSPQPEPPHKLSVPSKVVLPERETPKKYFQGISEWSERVAPPPKPLATKEFQEKLAGTLQRKLLRTSVEDVQKKPEDNYAVVNKRKDLRTQREDLGYLSGSRTDIRDGEKKKTNGYLTRQDSGYIRESREDLRLLKNRESSFIKDLEEPKISRDDSAYVSSSTYFTTTPRSPRRPRSPVNRTPDSGIKSPSPPSPEKLVTANVFPSVPERKRAIEKKLATSQEPPPDYSPPPRSRSHSPAVVAVRRQKTRFSESVPPTRNKGPAPQPPIPKPVMPAQTQTEPELYKEKKKVGSSIGNSLRKLVGKIRSASAERKMKLKSKTRSPSPQQHQNKTTLSQRNSATYQQYNVIDGHIGSRENAATASHTTNTIKRAQHTSGNNNTQQQQQQQRSAALNDVRRDRTVVERRGSSDVDANSSNTGGSGGNSGGSMITSPKQRFYLGENPYAGSIFGKENKYDGARANRNYNRRKSEEPQQYHSRNTLSTNNNASTLGRFSKSTNRLTATNSLNNTDNTDYRSTQTLPRKLEHKPLHSSTINVSIVNTVPKPLQNTGPAKPARTYHKSLVARSKSFNVHGLNGTNDPSPIFIEKVGRFNNTSNMYKSNPHLNEATQLKSPSIVNLISRSTRDLSNIPRNDDMHYERYNNYNGDTKKSIFQKSLQSDYAEPLRNGNLYKYRERESSLGSRSPVTINKDTATIIRRGSSSTEDYSETFKTTTKSADPERPGITNTVESFSRKTVPSPDGRGQTRIESREVKSVTSGHRYGTPKYIDSRPPRNGGVVIELRNRH